MAYFAELDGENKVIRTIAVHNNELDDNGVESEAKGIQFLKTLFGQDTVWKQASYNTTKGVHRLGGTPFRKNFASPDFTYDAAKDAFIPPKKHPSWVLDETTLRYVPPVAYPETFDMHAADPTYVDAEGNPEKDRYQWNEETVSWDFVG